MKLTINNYENTMLDSFGNEWEITIPRIQSEICEDEGICYTTYPSGIDLKRFDDKGEFKQHIHVNSLATMPDEFPQRKVDQLESEINEKIYEESGISQGDIIRNMERDYYSYTQRH